MKTGIAILSVIFFTISFAQETPNISSLKLDEIMKGYDFIGHSPENISWSQDGLKIIYEVQQGNHQPKQKLFYNITTKKTDTIPFEAWYKSTPPTETNSTLKKYDFYLYNGCIYAFIPRSRSVELIYQTSTPVTSLQFIPESENFYFVQSNGLFKMNGVTRSVRQILSFQKGKDPAMDKSNDFLHSQQEELFVYIRDEKLDEKVEKETSKLTHPSVPVVYIGESSIDNIQISGDGMYITFRLTDNPTNKHTEVAEFITDDGFVKNIQARAKVGAIEPTHKLGIYSIEKDSSYFVDFSKLSHLRDKPSFLKEYGDNQLQYENDRKFIMHEMVYSHNGLKNALDIRSYDNKDRWIVSINLQTGNMREIEHQHDDAWIGGPGISGWNMASGTLGWFFDNNWIYFQSEESGYSHLYSLQTETLERRQLTSGNWEVHNAELSDNGYMFYLTANKMHPGNREFYHFNLKTQEMIPVLTTEGAFEVTVSPNEKFLAFLYSTKNQPRELYFMKNEVGAVPVKLTSSQTKEFQNYSWYNPKVVTFQAQDGKNVYARLYEPEISKKNGAALIFVHGAGYLQNAHNYWSDYYREYMFHNMLRDNGFTVLDIDYRASEGYGRDWRTDIYRHMGGKDLSDQMDGRKYLIQQLDIDSSRIGIYGGSYGGFITLMALLTEPGKFKCGAALRSVTDWAHYNHEYTSNILNEPANDPQSYLKSSPIYFAHNLQDRLLMLHGMVDDNVQFQDVVRLSQRFIELGKENWELAVYPVEAHGFQRSDSWTNEYRRIYELFVEELILNQK